MKYLIVLATLALSACGSSTPIAPTPPPPAQIASQGNLTVSGCVGNSTATLYNCLSYSGVAQNTGSGCATGVRGVTTSFDAVTRAQTGSSGWSYSATVRPGEQIAYSGIALLVAGPLSGGWFYTTTMSWDNVKCP